MIHDYHNASIRLLGFLRKGEPTLKVLERWLEIIASDQKKDRDQKYMLRFEQFSKTESELLKKFEPDILLRRDLGDSNEKILQHLQNKYTSARKFPSLTILERYLLKMEAIHGKFEGC